MFSGGSFVLGLCPKIDYNRRPEMLLITQLCSHGCVCRVLLGSAILTSILYINLHNIRCLLATSPWRKHLLLFQIKSSDDSKASHIISSELMCRHFQKWEVRRCSSNIEHWSQYQCENWGTLMFCPRPLLLLGTGAQWKKKIWNYKTGTAQA